jgi:hypothetical protein
MRCAWCRRPFDTDEETKTLQELGNLKTKLMIPDGAPQPVICDGCYHDVMSQPLMIMGNRLLLGY